MNDKKFISNQAGFSLIEVAIVLAIIGIVVAGVFKGQDLLENARLKSIYSQVNEFRIATHTFRDRFGSLPGDYDQAKDTISDKLANGNNDGILQLEECSHFWAHLKEAQLLTIEKHFPVSRLGGQFTVVYNHNGLTGIWFCLGNKVGNVMNALLTPSQALTIMAQFDTVDPTTGRIQAKDGADTVGSCIVNTKLNTAFNRPACVLYFQL